MRYELIVENRGVFMEFDQVNRQRWDLGDHDATEGIGHGGVGVGEDEPYFMGLDGQDFYFRESLMRHCATYRYLITWISMYTDESSAEI